MNLKKLLMIAVALPMVTAFAANPAFGAGDAKAGAAGQKAFSYKGSDFVNMDLRNEKGDNLGRVREILFGADGTLTYVVVAPAGEIGNKLIPIPYSEEMWTFERDAAIVKNLDKSDLKKAPTLTLQELDKLNSPEFGSNVHGYYRDAVKQ